MEAKVSVEKLRDRGLYWNKTWKSTLSSLLLENTVLGGEQISKPGTSDETFGQSNC